MEQIAFLHILGSTVGLMMLLWGGVKASAWLRPHHAYAEKMTTYESGSEPMGYARGPINSRLYTMGLIFLLFEIETLLLFPWALVWAARDTKQLADTPWSLYMAILGTSFILLLGLGLVYVLSQWRHIDMDSPSSTQQPNISPLNPVPSAYYDQINARYASHQPRTVLQQPTNHG